MAQHEDLVKTALYNTHAGFGAKIAPFAGWAMPLEYAGTVSEHEAVRSDVGVFDVSHLGTVWIVGPEAEATVAATFTNDPADLADGESQYTLCCNGEGGVLDDLIVYRLASQRFLAIPNAGNTSTVVGLLEDAATQREADVLDESRQRALLAVQGPRSLEVMDVIYPDVGADVPHHGIAPIDLGPSDTGYIARTGYTGEVGVEVLLPGLDAPGVFQRLVEDLDVTPAGLGARDTLRLEMGYPLHGNDLGPDTNPFEARLSWAVALDRGSFRGREALARLADETPARRLLGLRATDRGIPRPGMVVTADGEAVGTVTSGNFSPTLRTGIGLAYLDARLGPGDAVTVDVRGRDLDFDVVRPPFVERDPSG